MHLNYATAPNQASSLNYLQEEKVHRKTGWQQSSSAHQLISKIKEDSKHVVAASTPLRGD